MTEVLEGRLHPLAVIVLARRVVGAGLLPVLVLILSGGAEVIVLVFAAAVAVTAYGILAWSRFRYRVAEGRLELRSGVFSRSVRTIPLERVRGVVVTAPFLHRLLGLVRVEVEAAAGGGSKAELSLPAVSVAQADALREVVLGVRTAEEGAAEPAALYRAEPRLLALGGVTSLSYLLAPTAVVGVVANLADNLPGGVVERAGDVAADNVPTHPLGIAVLVVGLVALVFLLAAAGSLLVDWGFTLLDEGERLTASRGLLTRRLVVLERARIRGVDVRDTPLRRPLGLASVTAIAAGLRGKTGGTTLAPVLPADDVAALLHAVDPAAPVRLWRVALTPHPAGARRRRLLRALALPAAALVIAVASLEPWAIALASLATILVIPLALDRYRQLGHRFDGRRLAVREGSLRRRWSELDPGAVVAFELRSSRGQRRAGLCTVAVHLGQGAGSRRALDVGERQAATLLAALHPPLLEPLVASDAGN